MLYGDGIHDDTLALQQMLDTCGVVTVDNRHVSDQQNADHSF